MATLPANPIDEVAHYTRIGTLCHLLGALPGGSSGAWNSAWATPVQFLNDRQELDLGLRLLRDESMSYSTSAYRVKTIIDSLLSTAGRLETDAFQMSFSGDPDEIGQWRGYAANGMGCSLATTVSALQPVADLAGWVIYDEADQKSFAKAVVSAAMAESKDAIAEQILIAGACFMKHPGFKPEAEFRVLFFPDRVNVQFRESGERLVPYFDYLKLRGTSIPLNKVVIGPGWQLASLNSTAQTKHHVPQGIRRLLDSYSLTTTAIEPSSIPYDPR